MGRRKPVDEDYVPEEEGRKERARKTHKHPTTRVGGTLTRDAPPVTKFVFRDGEACVKQITRVVEHVTAADGSVEAVKRRRVKWVPITEVPELADVLATPIRSPFQASGEFAWRSKACLEYAVV
jgi:hypothetical protein